MNPAVSLPIQRKVNRVSSGKGATDLHDHGSAAELFNLTGSSKFQNG